MSTKNKEIEFKYDASGMRLEAFHNYCKKLAPLAYNVFSGYDHFYNDTKDKSTFMRFRVGENFSQLTLKRKTAASNSFVRVEHNIQTDPGVPEDNIRALCQDLGFGYNTSIFKTAFIYKCENAVYSYYICYDVNMKQLGTFFEIEMDEDKEWNSPEEALTLLAELERSASELGITAKNRIKLSLFEMYKK